MFYPLAQLRQIEQAALAAGLPLMARAGLAAADFISARFGRAAHVLVLVGPGNNGGDALVAARHLRARGYRLSVLMPGAAAQLPADAADALSQWRAAGGQEVAQLPAEPAQLIIDGLFGIGLNRAPAGDWQALIEAVNARAEPVLALDVPSGIVVDSGAQPGVAIRARWTLSFIGTARGLLTGAACNHVGERHLARLDLPPELLPGGTLHSCAALAKRIALRREADSHKGRFGTLGIIGAAAGMGGAGLLAGRAALQSGAGKVLLAQLDPHGPAIDPLRPELMLRHFEADFPSACDVLVIGPGLGQSEQALAALQRVLEHDLPLLLDADALNLLAAQPALQAQLRRRNSPCVITPHPSEAARLLGCSSGEVQAQRFVAAHTLAERLQATVVLKGAGSIVAEVGRMAVNDTGSAAMANAGQGDVLSGLIGALLAQGLDGWQAANLGVWAHGAASDRLRARHGTLVTLADALAAELSALLAAQAE